MYPVMVGRSFSKSNYISTWCYNSCDKNPTIVHLTTGLRQTHRFSLQVFRFLVNHTLVYIHCDLRLCNRNIANSLCARSTPCSVRARRDVSSFDGNYHVSIGPVISREKRTSDSNKNKEDEKNNQNGTENTTGLT